VARTPTNINTVILEGPEEDLSRLRRVKQQIWSMLGFKRFDNAVVTISGIEPAEKIKKGQFKKGQFKTGKLGGCNATMMELCNAALAA
jgi:hypothetical protein